MKKYVYFSYARICEGFECSQDHVLMQHLSEGLVPGQIRHFPIGLYHRRVAEGSPATCMVVRRELFQEASGCEDFPDHDPSYSSNLISSAEDYFPLSWMHRLSVLSEQEEQLS